MQATISTNTRAIEGLQVRNSFSVGIGENFEFWSSTKTTIRNVFDICSVLTSCAPTVNKVSSLILDGHKIGQESLIEEDYIEKEIEDELAPISIHLAYT
jgi:hypothetical protein